jgi:hypothetical protein
MGSWFWEFGLGVLINQAIDKVEEMIDCGE